MDIVVDLNILRGDHFPNIENSNIVIPLLLIIELLNSESITEDGKITLLKKIIQRNYKIDMRHPRTIFCDFLGIENKDQKIYNIFLNKLFCANEISIDNCKDLIEWNKDAAKINDKFFTDHDFSKVLKLDIYRDNIKKIKPDIKKSLIFAIINEIKRLLVENFLWENNVDFNNCVLSHSLDVYYSVMAYYHFFYATEGRPKRNDFTDINYMLYLDKNRKFFTLDKKISNALNTVKPELLFSNN